jgi:hypothetical protein
MRRLLLALLLCAACGGSTVSSDGCSTATPQGTFTFHASRQAVDPFGNALCGALPTAFDVSFTVTATGATGTEAGVQFTASPVTSCQLTWSEATNPATEHVYEVTSAGGSLTIAKLGQCAAIYALTP